MERIAFILPSTALPVPAAKGGAIETLLTILLEQNESKGRFRFIFISPDKEDTLQKWRFSKCYTCSKKKDQFPPGISSTQRADTFNLLDTYPYDLKASLAAEYENADYIIMEGTASRILHCFENCSTKERRAIHLHHEFPRKGVYQEAFGITIAPSRYIARTWNQAEPKNEQYTYIVPNGIHTEYFMPKSSEEERSLLRKELGFTQEDFIVLFCGRLIEVKGVYELVSAILSIQDSSVKLLIVGSDSFAEGNSGNYAEKIINLAAKHPERIRYLGYKKNQDMPKYYHCADMQAVPSICEEAVGLVALEGMCSRLPLVITKSGGMVEYMPDGGGIIIEKEGDVISRLKRAIIWMKEHPIERRRMADIAANTAKFYSSEKYYSDFCDMMNWWETKLK